MTRPEALHAPALSAGHSVVGYAIDSFVGANEHGYVYVARDRRSAEGVTEGVRRKVHLYECAPSLMVERDETDVLRPFSSAHELAYAQARRDFQLHLEKAAALESPGIARIEAVHRAGGTVWAAIECIEAVELLTWAESRGPLTQANIVECIAPLIDALAKAHEMGLAHGRITPSKVRVRPSGRAVLLGIEQPPEYPFGVASVCTQSGLTAGGLRDFEGRARSDIQAVGRLLFRLVTGEESSVGAPLRDVRRTLLGAAKLQRYSRGFVDVVAASIAEHPEERISSMRTLADAIARDGTFDVPQSSAQSRLSQYFDRLASVRPEAVVSTVVLFIFAIVAARVAWQTRLVHDVGYLLFGAPNPVTVVAATKRPFDEPLDRPLIPVANRVPSERAMEQAGTRSTLDISQAMNAARRAFRAQRVTTPPHDNAFDRYLAVLTVEPHHSGALEGVNQIIDYYAERARQAGLAGNQERADTFAARVRSVILAAMAEPALGYGSQLWLQGELAKWPESEALEVSPFAEVKRLPIEKPRDRSVETSQLRLVARANRLASEAARALAGGEVTRARTLYETVLELVPSHETAPRELAKLRRLSQAGSSSFSGSRQSEP